MLEQRVLLTLTSGDLDPTFGVAGQVVTEFHQAADWSKIALTSALQADGKIVAAGEGALARYLPDGSLDFAFGIEGKAAFPYYARSIAVQTDGKIVVVGGSDVNSSQDFALARYLSNGTLDTSFDGDGLVLTDFGSFDAAYDVAIQMNGRIVVAGVSNDSVAVARYNIDGSLDTTFDGDGRVVLKINSHLDDTAYSVAIQANGRIVVGGRSLISFSPGSLYRQFLVMRLHANGVLDRSFGGDGYLNTPFGTGDEVRDLVVQPDGRILASGPSRYNFGDYLAMARYNTDGSLDTSFDQDGRRHTAVPSWSPDNGAGASISLQTDGRILTAASGYLYRLNTDGSLDTGFSGYGLTTFGGLLKTILVQPDGSIVVGGTSSGLFALGRFNSNGTRDNTFSGDGIVTTPFGPSIDEAGGSALQTDGKMIVVGKSLRGFGIARYNADGSPDLAFSQDGRTVIDFGPAYHEAGASDVVVQPDGKIIVVGFAAILIDNSYSSLFAVVRLNPDGSLDSTFSDDGMVTTDLGGYAAAKTVAIQPNGRIVVGGFGLGGYFTVARYRTDGSLDTSFHGDGSRSVLVNGNSSSSVASLVVQPDGKILAVGTIDRYTGGQNRSAVVIVRMNAHGSLDAGFGTNGRVIDPENLMRRANDVELLADGGFLVAGSTDRYFRNVLSSDMAVARYNSDGSLSSFGTIVEPIQIQSVYDPLLSYRANSAAKALLVQPNGKIVVVGVSEGSFILLQLNADGTRDTSFGGDGKVTTSFSSGTLAPVDLLQQSSGRLIAVGTLKSPYNPKYPDSDYVLVSYLELAEPASATQVTLNSAGQVEVRDLWSRDDQLEIHQVGNSLVLTDTTNDSHAKINVTGIAGATGNDTKQVTIPFEAIQNTNLPLLVSGLAGNDVLKLTGELDVVLATGLIFQGGPGDDRLSQESSTLAAVWNVSPAGSGNVTPDGQQMRRFVSVENLVGGQAADTFRLTAASTTTILKLDGGGSTLDTVQLSADANMLLTDKRLTASGSVSQLFALQGFEKAILIGGAGNNLLDASQFVGNANLIGQDGNDEMYGTRGDDVLNGGPGDDIVFGDDGNDTILGGAGNDVLIGDYGNDVLWGQDGNDIVIGGYGADILRGGTGEDILIGGTAWLFQRYTQLNDRTAIIAAWASPESFASRVTTLRDTGIPGVSGLLRLVAGSSVYNDLDIDTLFGDSGLDWFFASGSASSNEIGIATGGLRDLGIDEVLSVWP